MNKKRFYRFGLKKHSAVKRLLLITVSLLLAVMTFVSATMSWIEDVSQVEFSSTDGQETPLHIGSKILYSDAVMKKDPAKPSVNLSEYFQESGDMHLSPCYSDGENFYFPQEGNSNAFRVGTKDDANVNYLSITFRVQSEGASTAYWFEKTGSTPYVSFKNSYLDGNGVRQYDAAVTNSVLEKYVRCSITVDGATNVYAMDDISTTGYSKSYKTVENNAVTTKTGRSVEEYSYYDEEYNNDKTPNTSVNNAKANQGAGNNLNGNTLFTVNKYDEENKAATIKTVTLKIWLEYGPYNGSVPVDGVDVADINLNIVSGWDKVRRIYVKDETVDEIDNNSATGTHWLTTQNNPTLHWAIDGSESSLYWAKTGNAGSTYLQYFDIPAVYNNTACTLYRCTGNADDEHPGGWNTGNEHSPVNYWDHYPTTFPNTFHSETYTVYTKQFGTWESVARHVEIINSCQFNNSPYNNQNQFTQPYAYMWDSATDTGATDRVVQNASWPGTTMTKLNKKKSGLDVYAFYYNSIYDRIIFNDNYNPSSAAYQTNNIDLDQAKSNPQYYVGKVYDMATLKWYNDFNSLPTYSSYSVYSELFNSSDETRYTVSRMVENPNNSSEVYCRIYVRYASTGSDFYRFKVMKNDKTEWWGWGHDNTDNVYWLIDGQMTSGNQPTLENGNGSNDIRLHATNTSSYTDAAGGLHPGIYGFYFNTSNHKLWVAKESP